AFANSLETNLVTKNKTKSRGVKQAGFLVLRNTYMPSVLFEAGFLTNLEEERYLNSPEGQAKIVRSFIEAFEDYKNKVEDNPQLAEVKTEKQILHGAKSNVVQTTAKVDYAPVKTNNSNPDKA